LFKSFMCCYICVVSVCLGFKVYLGYVKFTTGFGFNLCIYFAVISFNVVYIGPLGVN